METVGFLTISNAPVGTRRTYVLQDAQKVGKIVSEGDTLDIKGIGKLYVLRMFAKTIVEGLVDIEIVAMNLDIKSS